MFEDHSVIMDNGTDMAVLTAVMQRLPKLSKLILRYGQDRNMRNTSKPVLPDCLKTVLTYRRDSIGHHLTACFQAIRPLGQIASQPITSLEISALKNKDIARYHSLAVVAEEAFSWIETLTIREFPSSFGYLVTEEITMPQLRKLAVTTDGGSMSLSHLKAFATETVEVSSSSHSVPASGC